MWPDFDFAKIQTAEYARAEAIRSASRAETARVVAAAEVERLLPGCFNQLIEFRWRVSRDDWGGLAGATRVYYERHWPVSDREPSWKKPAFRQDQIDNVNSFDLACPKPRRFQVIGWGNDEHFGYYLDAVEALGAMHVWRLFINDAQSIEVVTPPAAEQAAKPRRRRKAG